MLGIDPSVIQHELPVKPGCAPVVQSPRRLAPDLIPKIKEEIAKLLVAGFIQPVKYVEWTANIVPVIKKNGKIRICIDYRDINSASP